MPAPARAEKRSLAYRVVMAVATPIVRWWGRLEVVGLQALPSSGAVVLMCNHDSMWDPLVIGVAARNRQVRALAKASLWSNPIVARVLNGMGQIPIERGRGDLAAMAEAVRQLEAGSCIGVFPEGTVSRGEKLRALSGAGRLALGTPASRVVCATAVGVVDIVRFPRRPRLRVEFFDPRGGQPTPDESAVKVTRRVMDEIRERAPWVARGRHPA